MLTKRMIIGLSVGAMLGVVCIVGANLRSTTTLPGWYLYAFWFNRFLMGFVIALLPFNVKLTHKIIRGVLVGIFVSFAFYTATNYNDFLGFIVGGLYGIIIELAIHYGEKVKENVSQN